MILPDHEQQGDDLLKSGNRSFKRTHAAKVIFVLFLVVLSNLSFVAAFYLIFGSGFANLPANNFSAFIVSIPFISLGAVIGNDILKMSNFFHKSNLDIVMQAAKFTVFEILVTSTTAFAIRAFAFPRSVFLVGSVVLFLVTVAWSLCGMFVTNRLYKQSVAILIGNDDADIQSTKRKIENSLSRYRIVIDQQVYGQDIDCLLHTMAPFSEIMITSSVQESIKSRLILEASLAGKVIHLIPQYYELALYNATLLHLDDTLTFFIDRVALTFEQRFFKRIFDLIVSLLVILLTWPVMLACWIAVKLDSPGSGIFKQQRVTLNGRRFFILKFRTMFEDAEVSTGPVIATIQDPRVTRVGRILRRTKLDELPQFFNVLKGEMSVVGPRSERPFFVRQFSKEILGYTQRFKVKAGITGYAQIIGNYDTAPEDKLRYDLIYIRNYSILQDIKLILDTIRMILVPKLYKRFFVDKVQELAEREKKDKSDLENQANKCN